MSTFYSEDTINTIIDYVKNAKTKTQIKEYLDDHDYRDDYVFYRLFSLRDEEIVKKLPSQIFSSSECRMLSYFFGEEGEKYYPAKKRDQAKFYRGDNLRIVEKPICYGDFCQKYVVYHSLYDGDDELGHVYNEYYKSIKDYLLKDGTDLKGKWLYDAKIPKTGIKDIDFTGAYVKKEDAERLKGSIGVEERIIRKEYNPHHKRFIVYYGFVDSEGNLVRKGDYQGFKTFREFATFVKKDLSYGYYDGYDFSKIKLERYNTTGAHFCGVNSIEKEIPSTALLEELNNNSSSLIGKKRNLPVLYREEEYGDYCLYYISDLHLDHKIIKKCKNDKEIDRYINTKINQIKESMDSSRNYYYYAPLVIVGDVSFSFELNKLFYTKLREYIYKDIIVVLGNHELWLEDYQTQIEKYKSLFADLEITFLDNGMYTITKNTWEKENKHYYSEQFLLEATQEQIREIVRDSHISFFGGIGYAGKNNEFNALNGIYRDALTREQEIKESERFEALYSKLLDAIGDKKNIVVVSHMPPKDWTDKELNKNWAYMYGHNHRNMFQNDENGIVLADNQVGYKERNFSLNCYIFNGTYDIFSDYKDGIYEITAEQYKDFCFGKGIVMQYTTKKPVITLKKKGVYLFMQKSNTGYCIMNGGKPNKVEHTPEYYYKNMDEQINAIMIPLNTFTNYQKQYSSFVKSIGGTGIIHGCIVDIDFYNHIYINPLDGTATPYYATNTINKMVYHDMESLLEEHCPKLLDNYVKNETLLPAIQENNLINKTSYYETDIYRMSRVIRAMQYLQNEAVLRCWYEKDTDPYEILEDNEAMLPGKKHSVW